MRLTAAYVLAAIVLVAVVIAAVTAFALSIVGSGIRESAEAVARQAPEEVRQQVGRYGSLAKAAHQIAQLLARPGLQILIVGDDGIARTVLANTGPKRSFPRDHGPLRDGSGPALGRHHPPPFEMNPLPLGLSGFLRLKPQHVEIPGGHIVILPDAEPLKRTINAFWLVLLSIGFFVVAAAALLGRAIAGQALRPLVETTESLRRFGEGDFTPRAVVTTERNEIGELARAYNAAAAQVSAAFEERRAAEQQMRQFIADAGHELRTPLTVVMGFIDVLRRRAANDSTASLRIYDAMLVESRRMKALIEKLIVLARLESAHPRELETVDMSEVAQQVVATLQTLDGGSRLHLLTASGAIVRGYENELHDALRNLLENALKYAPQARTDVAVRVEGDDTVVDVTDAGPGIALDEQTQVFARFYRGRERGDTEGFGLGLAIAQRAVERAGGRILLESTLGQGSRFTMRIPRAMRGHASAVAV